MTRLPRTRRIERPGRSHHAYAVRLRKRGFSIGCCRTCGGVRTPFWCATCQARQRKRAAREDHYVDPKTGKCRVCFQYSDPLSRLRHNTRASCEVCKRSGKKLHQHWLYGVSDHEMSRGPCAPRLQYCAPFRAVRRVQPRRRRRMHAPDRKRGGGCRHDNYNPRYPGARRCRRCKRFRK